MTSKDQTQIRPAGMFYHPDGSQMVGNSIHIAGIKKHSTFRQLLSTLNPWWWMEMGEASGALHDSALANNPAWTGAQQWNAFPMPPPTHTDSTPGAHAPIALTGADVVYGVSGATNDNRKAIKFGTAGTSWFDAVNWGASNDSPFFALTPTSVVWWHRWTANMAATVTIWQSPAQQSGGNPIIIGCNQQTTFGLYARDSSNVLKTYQPFAASATILDGNWHLIGCNFSGSQKAISCDLYVDGVFSETGSLSTTATSLPFATLSEGLAIAKSGDFFVTAGGGFAMQDFAILPNNGGSCKGISAIQYAELYASR